MKRINQIFKDAFDFIKVRLSRELTGSELQLIVLFSVYLKFRNISAAYLDFSNDDGPTESFT